MSGHDIASLFKKIDEHFDHQLPFAVYNKPNSKKVIGVFQSDNTLHKLDDFTEHGFAFASFDSTKMVVIRHDQSEIVTVDVESLFVDNRRGTFDATPTQQAQSRYEQLVQKGIDMIQNGNFGKVVLSRKETVTLPQFELTSAFQKLVQSYPTAFAYCFFHPKIGLWLGAFSEQLVRVRNKNLHTMAVAGTQVYDENKATVWQSKEMAEQQFVTDFITKSLDPSVSQTKISEPYTMKAGNLVHIKTDIEAVLNHNADLKEVLTILHPTPAVCGFPKDQAKQFILDHEGYDREFYAGFLGELNHDVEKNESSTDLYVNLRCMKVENNSVSLYVGCGITKDSNPEREWLETVNKSKTIKQILF